MKIFLDKKELGDEYRGLTLPELLDSVKNSLKDKILKHIYINKVEVNERYLLESTLDKDDIKIIEFVTQSTGELIKETLNEVERYLPVLKTGVLDTADLFRNGKDREANEKYQLIIEGIGWYTEVISGILALMDNDGYYQQVQKTLNEFNESLTDLMIAHQKDDLILLADILEYEISEFIDEFISISQHISTYY
ncbi:MAG: hypothetical protein GX175_04800 [Halanaerobiaceae bacterium]|nr:hypothetical protein [Halanaerobiaceae bacterium]